MVDILAKLHTLLDERGWTPYRLARVCKLSESTIINIYKRNTIPTIPTLESICCGFNMTLSEFFAEGDLMEATPEMTELLALWRPLKPSQKSAILQVAHSYFD